VGLVPVLGLSGVPNHVPKGWSGELTKGKLSKVPVITKKNWVASSKERKLKKN